MYSFTTILLANFKKRKAQSFLAALIIMAAAMLFTTALGTITSIDAPFEKMYKDSNASQIQTINFNEIYNTNDIAKWWKQQEGITVQTFKSYYSADNLLIKGNSENVGGTIFAEKPEYKLTQDKMTIVEGQNKLCPANDEVWVCIYFADRFKLHIGDKIGIPTKSGTQQKRISAIITDPQFGAPSMGTARLWLAPGQIDKTFSNEANKAYLIGLHFDDYSKRTSLWKSFEEYLGRPYVGNLFDYELVSTCYLMTFKYIGAILLIFAFILITIALLIICFTISTAVASDIKVIGVLKTQGFTPLSVTWLYTVQYTILSLVSVLLGIVASSFIVRIVTNMVTRSMGVSSIDISLLMPALVTIFILVSLVLLASFITARKAGGLKPVKAIREELLTPKKSIGIGLRKLKFASVSLMVAIRQCFSQKAQSTILLLIAFALASVLTFSINLINTFAHVYENAPDWGHDRRSDSLILKESATQSLRNNIFNEISKDKRIKVAIPATNGGSECKVENDDKSKNKSVFLVVYDGDIDRIGAKNLQGRNPTRDNEVSISLNVQKEFGKTVGDYINVSIAGKRLNLLVTGVYQTSNYMGWGLRLQKSTIEKALPSYTINNYALIFTDSNARKSFIDDYMKEYPGQVEVQPFKDLINTWMYGTISGINTFLIFLTGIFVIVMVIIIFNSTLINIFRDKKSYGIYKSIGLTPAQIRKAVVYRAVLLAVIGTLVAIPTVYFTAGKLMTVMLSGMGIEYFPMNNSIPETILVIPACILIALVGCWVPSGRVKNISARELIME